MLNYIMIEVHFLLNGILKDTTTQKIHNRHVFLKELDCRYFLRKVTKQNLNFWFCNRNFSDNRNIFLFQIFQKGYEIKAVGQSDTVAEKCRN